MAAVTFGARSYYLLTKPGILFGNAVTTVAGFLLASKGKLPPSLFVGTLLGLSLVIASACVFNNYIDRKADEKMARTKDRPLVKGLISGRQAIIFATLLGVLGPLLLALFSNMLALGLALFGFFMYVILYSFSKYHSTYGTLIGSIAGAIPPVVGYCAARGQFDAGAIIFFLILALWQMPHFFAIAIYRMEEYKAASIPVLPIKRGMHATKVQMLLYILAFIATASLLFVFHYVGYLYLAVASTLGLYWLVLCCKGFKAENDRVWAKKMFFFSLVVVMGICFAIPFSISS